MLTARTNQWHRPQVVDEPVLKIKHGRHPLVERLIESYIPNSTILVSCHDFIVIKQLEWADSFAFVSDRRAWSRIAVE